MPQGPGRTSCERSQEADRIGRIDVQIRLRSEQRGFGDESHSNGGACASVAVSVCPAHSCPTHDRLPPPASPPKHTPRHARPTITPKRILSGARPSGRRTSVRTPQPRIRKSSEKPLERFAFSTEILTFGKNFTSRADTGSTERSRPRAPRTRRCKYSAPRCSPPSGLRSATCRASSTYCNSSSCSNTWAWR